MFNNRLFRAAAVAVGALIGIASSEAHATVWTFNGNAGGMISQTRMTASFDDQTNRLSVTYNTFMAGQRFTSIVLGGDTNPNNNAVLWVDTVSGNVSAYRYVGQPSTTALFTNTYNASNFIAGFIGAAQVNGNQISFEIDATAIQNFPGGAGWEGVAFANSLHSWMSHWWYAGTYATQAFQYDARGMITRGVKDDGVKSGDFHCNTSGNCIISSTTTSTGGPAASEPAALGLFGIAALGMMLNRRRRSVAA